MLINYQYIYIYIYNYQSTQLFIVIYALQLHVSTQPSPSSGYLRTILKVYKVRVTFWYPKGLQQQVLD